MNGRMKKEANEQTNEWTSECLNGETSKRLGKLSNSILRAVKRAQGLTDEFGV